MTEGKGPQHWWMEAIRKDGEDQILVTCTLKVLGGRRITALEHKLEQAGHTLPLGLRYRPRRDGGGETIFKKVPGKQYLQGKS